MIGYGRQDINQADRDAVERVLSGDYLTCGPAVDAFEEQIKQVSGAQHAIAVNNGTSALRLLYQVAGIGPGSVVGVPAITFVATASQAMLLGAKIILLDVDPDTHVLTPEILDACEEKLDYVIPVHMAGRLCDMSGIAAWAAQHNCIVLEDAAHAFGSSWNTGELCGDGTWSQGAIFSFHPVKNITCGEGGAIVVNNAEYAEKLRSFRHHGIQRVDDLQQPWMHAFHAPATNERLSDIHAALGSSQCQRLSQFKQRRAEIHDAYTEAFSELDFISVLPAEGQAPFWHLSLARLDWDRLGHDRTWLFNHCREQGVQLQVHYIPLHHQPILAEAPRASALEGAEQAYAAHVSLPCFPALTEADQTQVIDIFRNLA